MVGETVITIGNAFGYENTVSVGIISALKRNVTLSDEQVYRNLIQTDACINPGNSGGPLVNIDGELIGINVAVRAGAQGIGFALPIDDVKRVAAEMMSTRRLASDLARPGRGRGAATASAARWSSPRSSRAAPPRRPGSSRATRSSRSASSPVTTPLDIERGLLDARPASRPGSLVRRDGQEQALALDAQAPADAGGPVDRRRVDAASRSGGSSA